MWPSYLKNYRYIIIYVFNVLVGCFISNIWPAKDTWNWRRHLLSPSATKLYIFQLACIFLENPKSKNPKKDMLSKGVMWSFAYLTAKVIWHTPLQSIFHMIFKTSLVFGCASGALVKGKPWRLFNPSLAILPLLNQWSKSKLTSIDQVLMVYSNPFLKG